MIVRHFLIAWIRHLRATRFVSAISILGLAIGLAAAFAMALIARAPLGYNGFLPAAERIWMGVSVLAGPDMPPDHQELTSARAAGLIAANVPEVEAIGRAVPAEFTLGEGDSRSKRGGYWADPALFDVLRFRSVAGDPVAALERPDGLVMTQSEARRQFGPGAAPGARTAIDGRPMILRAILADPPAGRTDLVDGIFVSGLAAGSALAPAGPVDPTTFSIEARTYLRLAPGADPAAAERRVVDTVRSLVPAPMRPMYRMRLARIDRLALDEGLHPGAGQRLAIGGLVAGLILFVAVSNFINLSVALAARRRREIGVRKACGASRIQLAAQHLGESLLTVLVAALLAAAATELLLPRLTAFLEVIASLDFLAEPALLGWLLAGAVAIGLLAGAWPAAILSALEPAATLRNEPLAGRGAVRNLLVTAQFAILIALLIATAIIWQQRVFASGEALRAEVDRVVVVTGACPRAFVAEARKLAGVEGVACSGHELLTGPMFAFIDLKGTKISTDVVRALPAVFEVYGIRPVAGSFAALPSDGEEPAAHAVINEAAVARFGMGTPDRAIGKAIPLPGVGDGPNPPAQVVAVVPDFAFYPVTRAIQPTVYMNSLVKEGPNGLVSIRLGASHMKETLRAIDGLWRSTGQAGPIDRAFVSDRVAEQYRDLERGTQLFAAFAAIAAALSCLGLVGLSIAAAERRTKEIGIRKVLGARTGQILRLLLAQLTRPVLWANLIAWPAAWWGTREWLNGFAYRVPIDWRLFPAAGAIALGLAVLATGAQAWRAARARPVEALRYE